MEVDAVMNADGDLRGVMALVMRDEKRQILEANQEVLSIIRSLGGDSSKYRRERQRALKAVVPEFYLPPRVTAAT